MDDSYTRRGLLKTGTGAAAGLVTAGAAGTASAQGDAYEGYLADEGTWEGQTADATGMDEVTVEVGASGNGGNFAFSPAAIVVEPGTTVTWEWTGQGGQHNVVAESEAFESQLVEEEGFTFDQAFDEEATYQYFCLPHKSLQMKGVVAVGADNAQGDVVDFDEAIGAVDFSASPAWAGAAAFGTVSLLGVAAYREMFGEE